MSVNLSPEQVADPDIRHRVRRSYLSTGVSPEHVSLELTEGAFIKNPAAAAETLLSLKELGFKLSLDDFGTGYSSLSYLNRFPFDVLKVDRSFVQCLESDGDRPLALVRAIASMALALGMSVVAEGVETAGQGAIVRGLGCQFAQGYYYHRPLAPEDAGARLAESVRPIEAPTVTVSQVFKRPASLAGSGRRTVGRRR